MKFLSIDELKNKLSAVCNPPSYVIKQDRTEDGVDGRIVSYADRTSYIAEQYKALRTNLYSLSPGKPIQTLIVTSSQSQEGKTITSCNLAFALSQDTEKKVVLIDSDFRRPAIHSMFGLQRKPGLSDILSLDNINIENFTKKPVIGNLFVIPSGTTKTNPSEILISTKIKSVIDNLRSKFDYIIFDTPPVLSVTDACILGSLCDAVILVVKAGVTQKHMIEESYNLLTGAQAKPKGCILTNVHFLLDAYHYYYRYTNYAYGPKKEGM